VNDTQFIDTNIFLRFLTHDEALKHQACLRLFQQAEQNQITLYTSEAIIAEVVYVLSSPKLYHVPRQQIHTALVRLLILPGLKLPTRQICLRALDLYVKHLLDFEDCLSLAHMEQQHIHELYSYDRSFDRIAAIQRLEPEMLEKIR
jgi:predicted nucleic acid-binding protein